MATPTFPLSVPIFTTDTYNFDPLLAAECISQSATIAASLGVLKRGTVLYGAAVGAAMGTLTTVVGALVPRAILAQDINTGTGSAVTGLVYTQGKFLDTAMTFSSKGAALDAAGLWDIGCYVLTVLQRSGLLVPFNSLPGTGGPLPQMLSIKDQEKAEDEEVERIRNAKLAYAPPGTVPVPPGPGVLRQPPWAIAEYGDLPQTPTEEAWKEAAEEAGTLEEKHRKALADLEAKQAEERSKLAKQQTDERDKYTTQAQKDLQQAQAEEAREYAQMHPQPQQVVTPVAAPHAKPTEHHEPEGSKGAKDTKDKK
jgi:hypothetical protein